jgi:hypothetical protein
MLTKSDQDQSKISSVPNTAPLAWQTLSSRQPSSKLHNLTQPEAVCFSDYRNGFAFSGTET